MFVARLICSDMQCAAGIEAEAPAAPELETFVCDCGFGMDVIGWPDWVSDPAQVIALPVRRALRAAA